MDAPPPIDQSPAPSTTHTAANPIYVERKHSGLGIASTVLAVTCAVLLFGSVVAAAIMQKSGLGPRQPMMMLLGLGFILLIAGEMTALGLGIAALFQRGRQKLFGILGIVFSGTSTLMMIGLIILGMMIRRR